MKKFTFLKNAAILTVTALILRTLGIFFRIYMSNIIGAEGMGLYQLIFSVYVLAAAFAAGGISTAVTRLCADELACGSKKSTIKILHKALILTGIVSLASMLLVFFGADAIAGLFLQDMRAAPALRILCPSLPFMGISSCLRGYFIARRKTGNPSAAQIFEQLVRIGVVMLLLTQWAGKGVTWACAAVLLGDTVAEICSCGYMYIGFLRDKGRLPAHADRPAAPAYPVYKRILSIALPITGSRYLNTVLRTAENLLIPGALSRYAGGRAFPVRYAQGHGYAHSLFPLLLPFGPLHPVGARNFRSGGQGTKAQGSAYRQPLHPYHPHRLYPHRRPFPPLCPSIGYGHLPQRGGGLPHPGPCSHCAFYVSGKRLRRDPEGAQPADQLLCLQPGRLGRILLILALVPMKGMQGFLAVMVFSNILTSCLNIRRLLKVTDLRLRLVKWIFLPLLAFAGAGAAGYSLFTGLEGAGLPLLLSMTIAILACGCLYLIILLLTGGVRKEDLQAVRPGDRKTAGVQ